MIGWPLVIIAGAALFAWLARRSPSAVADDIGYDATRGEQT